VRAFGWSEIERFGETAAALPGRLRPLYPHLEVTLRAAQPLGEDQKTSDARQSRGRLAAAWFDAPLPLIIRVAEAYRVRQTHAR